MLNQIILALIAAAQIIERSSEDDPINVSLESQKTLIQTAMCDVARLAVQMDDSDAIMSLEKWARENRRPGFGIKCGYDEASAEVFAPELCDVPDWVRNWAAPLEGVTRTYRNDLQLLYSGEMLDFSEEVIHPEEANWDLVSASEPEAASVGSVVYEVRRGPAGQLVSLSHFECFDNKNGERLGEGYVVHGSPINSNTTEFVEGGVQTQA